MYNLAFISEKDFILHISNTLKQYYGYLEVFDLKKFSKNIIDPIKLTFDRYIQDIPIETLINTEILRQQDKSINNLIGFFHQNIFQYIDDCRVPSKGFDIISDSRNLYVEMKNKHNTMNSNASQKVYINMQQQLIKDPKSTCILVEIISKKRQNGIWRISLNGEYVKNDRIKKYSIDEFYYLITSDKLAFYKICQHLPYYIKLVNKNFVSEFHKSHTVIEELNNISPNILINLYKLTFGTYYGFSEFCFKNKDEI